MPVHRVFLFIVIALVFCDGVGIAQESPAGLLITSGEQWPVYSMIRSATSRAIQSSGLALDGNWLLSVGPIAYQDIGLHAVTGVIAEAGGSIAFLDSAVRDRISLQILEAGQRIDSIRDDALRPRTSTLSMSFLITDARGRIRFSEVLHESMLDTIPSAGPELAGRPMGKREDSFWERLLIPFAIVGAAGVAVFLLFHVRS